MVAGRMRGGGDSRLVLYTCTFLDYDQVLAPMTLTPGVAHVLISDRKPRLAGGWRWRPLPRQTAGMSQAMANRWCKFFPDALFPDAEATIYVDGNTLIVGDLRPLIDEFRSSGAPIGLFRHQKRRSVAQERDFCLEVGKISAQEAAVAQEQIEFYRAQGFPEKHVLTENGVILRRGGDTRVQEAMTLWWEQINRFSRRDQLSLPYVLHATGLRAHLWDWDYKADNPYFFRFARYPDSGRRLLVRLETLYRFGRAPYLTRKVHAGLKALLALQRRIVGRHR